jgi:tetratricopeptide (TPR) repeat protein
MHMVGVLTRLTLRIAGASLLVAGALLHAQQAALTSSEAAGNALRAAEPEFGTTSPGMPSAAMDAPVPPQTSSSIAGQLHPELEVLTNVLNQHRRAGNRDAEAGTLCALGNSYNALGQRQKAIEQFKLALAIYRELGDRKGMANALSLIGDGYRGWGFPEQAVDSYRSALENFARTDDKTGTEVALNNLGVAYISLGDKKKSLEYLKRALNAYRDGGDRRAMALTLINIGAVENFLGHDPGKALGMLQEAATELDALNDHRDEADAFELMGAVWTGLHKQELAESNFQRALAFYREVGDAKGEASVLRHMRDLGRREDFASAR